MSLPEVHPNEELVAFGMPWHGLLVKPLEGLSYVELANGRQIASTFFSAPYYSGSTGLVDLEMPEPSLTIEDPDADFWNTYICDFAERTIGFWGVGGNDYQRPVRVGESLALLECQAIHTFNGNIRVDARRRLLSEQIPMEIVIAPPAGSGTLDRFQGRIIDITPNGRKWLFAFTFSRNFIDYPYAFRVESDADEGLGAIIEVEFNEDFTSLTGRYLADRTDCMVGRNITAQDGGPLADSELWLVGDGSSGVWTEWGATEPPTPPYQNPLTAPPGVPVKAGVGYSTGSSTGTASADFVVGAWFSPDGEAQLVTLHIETLEKLTAQAPVSRTDIQQWWSPYVREHRCSITARVGAGAFQPFFEFSSIENQNPQSTSYEIKISQTTYNDTETNLPAVNSLPFGEVVAQGAFARHEPPKRTGVFASGYGGKQYSGVWNAAWTSANKVLTVAARVMGVDLFEYVLGAAITPAGVVTGDAATGNVIPGHDRKAPGFDQAIWDNYRCFSQAAYNPVTGQVARCRFGLNTFTWV